MKNKQRICFTAMLAWSTCVAFSSLALAEQQPKAGQLDARIRTVAYRENDVVAIQSHYGISTLIVFADEEIIETITDYTNPNSLQARELASRTFAQAIQDMANEEFKESNSIQDTIHINQGTPIAVFVRNDLDFSHLYPNPVWQKYQELRRHAK